MPIVDASDPAVWTAQYRRYLNHPTDKFAPRIAVGYTRAGFLTARKRRGHRLVDRLGLQDGQNILLVGAAFGWMGEGIQDRLPTATIIGVDNSTWVQSRKGLNETDEIRAAVMAAGMGPDAEGAAYVAAYKGGPRAALSILGEDGLSGASRGRVKRRGFGAINAVIDWAITEDVLPWLTDTECQALDTAARQLALNVCHLLTPFLPEKAASPEPQPAWNWKTVADWEAFLPNSTIVAVSETG